MKKKRHSILKRKQVLCKKPVTLLVVLTLFTVIYASQAIAGWTTHGPAGLGIYDIAIDPHESSIVYVVGGTNAVYKSTNGGISFVGYDEGIVGGDSLQAVAIDPNYPFVLYACGMYFYRSNDEGETWSQVGEDLPQSQGESYCHKDILIDPTDPYIVYVATWALGNGHRGGVYKSVYMGEVFDDVTPEGIDEFLVNSITMDAGNPCVIYAGVEVKHVEGAGGVWRTTNSGESWTQNAHWAPEQTIVTVEADPNITGRLFAGGLNNGCWRSDDYGDSWELVLPVPAGSAEIGIRGTVVFYACGDGLHRSLSSGDENTWDKLPNPDMGLCTISVSETQEGLLFVGGGYNFFKNLLKSMDFGDSFTPIVVSRFQWLDVNCIASATTVPSTTVYSGGDYGYSGSGGLFQTENNGYAWFQTMFPTLKVIEVAVCPDDPSIILAVHCSDAAGARHLYRSTDGGDHSDSVPTPRPVQKLMFDPINTNRVYAIVTPPQNPPRFHFCLSNDYGATWAPMYDQGIGITTLNTLVFTSSEGTDALYAGAYNGVYKSTNGGLQWNHVGLAGIDVTSLSVCDLLGGGIVAGTADGVYRTIDGGASWQQVGLAGVPINDVYSDVIETRFSHPSQVYFRPILFAATNQGVYEYVNGNWVPRNEGLEAESLEVRELTLTKPLPFTIVPELRINLAMQQALPRILLLSEGNGFTNSGQGPQNPLSRTRDDIEPSYQIRRSVLHAATPLGTYEYVFMEP